MAQNTSPIHRFLRLIRYCAVPALTYVRLRLKQSKNQDVQFSTVFNAAFLYTINRKICTKGIFSKQVFVELQQFCQFNEDELKSIGIRGVFVSGSVASGLATPLHILQGGQVLSVHSYSILRLWEILLSRRRFTFSNESDIDILLFVADNISDRVKQLFSQRLQFHIERCCNYSPTIDIRTRTSDKSLLGIALNSRCLYASPELDTLLSNQTRTTTYLDLRQTLLKRIDNAQKPKHRAERAHACIANTFHSLRNSDAPFLSLNPVVSGDHAPALEIFSSSRFDRIDSTDITSKLNDGKGHNKPRFSTILRIDSVCNQGKTIPVDGLVLKIRDSSGPKTSALADLDLLKEYYLTERLNKVFPAKKRRHLLQTYGIFFCCERISAGDHELGDFNLGIVFSEIGIASEQRATSLRLTGVSRPWYLLRHLKEIQLALKDNAQLASTSDIVKLLIKHYALLLLLGLDVSACDFMIIQGSNGEIQNYLLFDFEKVSLQNLFNESHLITTFLIDYYQHVPKRGEDKQRFEKNAEYHIRARNLFDWVRSEPILPNSQRRRLPSGHACFRLISLVIRTLTLYDVYRLIRRNTPP